MTVLEVVRTYNLELYAKHYKNVLGNSRDVAFPLAELTNMEVKSVSINFPTNEATITLLTEK
jgi:hypothetical protein